MKKNKKDIVKSIDRILGDMNPDIHSGDKNIRFSKLNFYYHSIPDLEIEGYRNCAKRGKQVNLLNEVKGKSVLDIGSNMGMLTIESAKTANYVCGVETSPGYIEISNILKEFYSLDNIDFDNSSFLDHVRNTRNKYDIILAFAIHNWIGEGVTEFMETCKSILNTNGVVIFETHRVGNRDKIKVKIKKANYRVKRIVKLKSRDIFRCVFKK